jgi:hypothetical protein
MMTPEEFAGVAESVAAGNQITQEQAAELIDMVRRLDILVLIFQNSLELMAQNAYEAIPVIAEKVMQRCGRTDHKTKKSIAEQAATAVASCDNALQSYMTVAMIEAAKILNISVEELLGMPEQEAPVAEQPEARVTAQVMPDPCVE